MKNKDNLEKLKDVNIFEDKSFGDLLSEIYAKSNANDKKIAELLGKVSNFMTNAQTASIIGPIVGEYIDKIVKNDDQLIKLAAIIQRHYKDTQNLKAKDSEGELPSEELSEIRDAIREREGKIVKMGS